MPSAQLDLERFAVTGGPCGIPVLADESDDFLAESLGALSPLAEKAETLGEVPDLKACGMGVGNPLEALAKKAKECEFVAVAGLPHEISQ